MRIRLNGKLKKRVGWANGSIVNPTLLSLTYTLNLQNFQIICWVAKETAVQPTLLNC